jgi:hypothetical protein
MGGHQSHGKGEKIWLTPPDVIEALGPFDLDPCFGFTMRPWDTAAEHWGPESNGGLGGLFGNWHGLVWCNPPYDSHAFEWLQKCADYGNAVALIFARTEVAEFHRQIWERADAILFLEGRLYFHHPDGRRAAHNSGAPSVLVAYGNEAAGRIRNSGLKGKFIDLRPTR